MAHRYKKFNKSEAAIMQHYKDNPSVAQSRWYELRSYPEAAHAAAYYLFNSLALDTNDIQLQTLVAKCRYEWEQQHKFDGIELTLDNFMAMFRIDVMKFIVADMGYKLDM